MDSAMRKRLLGLAVVLVVSLAFPALALARSPMVFKFRPLHPARLQTLKAVAARRVGHGASGRTRGLFARPLGSVAGGLSGTGLGASESGQDTPPDTTGSIGPSNYVEAVNDEVAVFDRNTLARLSMLDNETFMNAPSGTSVTDPQMQWDPRGGRWFYLAAAITEDVTGNVTGPNYLLFGWSKTADPTNLSSGWCRENLASNTGGTDPTLLDDYPKLGHDDTHLVFGSQLFDNSSNNALSARVWILPKPAVGDTSCPGSVTPTSIRGSPSSPLTTSGGNNAGVVVPANTFDASSGDYVVSANDPSDPSSTGTESKVMAWHVSGSGTLVPDGEFTVNPYGVPPSAPQPSSANVIDTLDGRLTEAVALADPAAGGAEAVWTQQTIADPNFGGGRAVVRWYELLPASLTLRQQGDIGDPTGHVFNAAISPSANSGMTSVFYNVSSTTSFPSIRARDRSPALAPGALGDETTILAGSGPDTDGSCTAPSGPPCRWGDYSGAAPDPANANLVWGANQIVTGQSGFLGAPRWATQIFAFGDSPPAAAFNAPPGSAGVPLTLDGSPSHDPDGHIASYLWNFGDGATGGSAGPTIAHAYAKPGSYNVTLQVTSDSGQVATTSHPVTVADVPPQISKLRVTHKRFRVGKQRTAVSAKASPRGTTFVYALSEAARMTFTIQRPLPGRRVGHSCKKQTRKNAKRHRCTRLKTVFAFARGSAAGSNRKAFSGRAGRKAMALGKYSARLVATDVNGGRSAARSVSFTIVRG